MHAQTTLTSKGQLTLPKAIRDHLHLHAGDRLEIELVDDGSLRMVKSRGSVRDLKGLLPKPAKALSVEDMEVAIRRRRGE